MKSILKFAAAAFGLGVALLLSGCGGGGTTTDQMNAGPAAASATGLRALPSAFTTRRAVSYSPYRTATDDIGRATEVITDQQVKDDLDLLVTAGIGLIRIFDSSDKVALRTLRVISTYNMDIKVMQGIYVNSFEYETNLAKRTSIQAANEDEMARGVTLAKSFPNQVIAVSVGNETMVSWSFVPISTATMAVYIKTVRDQISQPVTTDDNWAFYAGKGRNASDQAADIFRQIDFASIHTYPIEDAEFSNFSDSDPLPDWDWQQKGETNLALRARAMMDAAIEKTKSDYAAVRTYLDRNGRANLPIIIGETGWKAADPSGTGRYKFLGHPANQKMYYNRLLDWAVASRSDSGPKAIVYFEAFDEPWKRQDDNWGLFNVARQARCAVQGLNPAATWAKDTSKPCDEASALYYTPPVLNTAVTSPSFVIHSEAVTGWPAGMRADAYQGGTFTLGYPLTGDSAPGDLASTLGTSRYISLTGFNNSAGYGWGLLWQSSATPTAVTANLSNFASGSIRFSVKTAYVGSLRVGISSDTELGRPVEAFVLISNGTYGYCNTGTVWCDVSIPLSAFKAANPALDLRYVLTRFSLSDIWSVTGNAARSGMPEIRLDNVYWAQ
jgi:exo-beta-1,3-glucanase (GH17 family)